jgi:hypothetical protein
MNCMSLFWKSISLIFEFTLQSNVSGLKKQSDYFYDENTE